MKLIPLLKTTVLAAALMSANGVAQTTIQNPLVESYLATQTTLSDRAAEAADILVVAVPEGAEIALAGWSDATVEHVRRVAGIAEFEGKQGQREVIVTPQGLEVKRLVLIGVGDPAELTRAKAEDTGAALSALVNDTKAERVSVNGGLISDPADNGRILAAIAHGVDLRNYRFDRFQSEPKARPAQQYHYQVTSRSQAADAFQAMQALAEGVFLARELTNLPGSSGYPAAFAEYARQALEPLGVKVTILKPEQVLEMGMGALYGVSQGSQHKAHLLVAHWEGSSEAPIALVGKGNTHDTGGYNLKTKAATIHRMPTDKAGGAAVVGAMVAIAGQRIEQNVVGVVPLSQNSISGEALLPGDVVTTGSGQTIEVANTDAEGRLILADGLWYVREHYKPRVIADIATLTGAKMTAVGTDFSAVFANNEFAYETLKEASEEVQERIWRLPLDPAFEKSISSRIADMKNTGSPGASAGAMLLQRFVGDTPWIHIDMAGNADVDKDEGIHPVGATGYGVRMLTEWVKRYPTDSE